MWRDQGSLSEGNSVTGTQLTKMCKSWIQTAQYIVGLLIHEEFHGGVESFGPKQSQLLGNAQIEISTETFAYRCSTAQTFQIIQFIDFISCCLPNEQADRIGRDGAIDEL